MLDATVNTQTKRQKRDPASLKDGEEYGGDSKRSPTLTFHGG